MKNYEWILREKPYQIFTFISHYGKQNILMISKKADVTYGYTFKLIHKMEKAGLVTGIKRGRETRMIYTNKGIELRKLLTEVYDMMEESK